MTESFDKTRFVRTVVLILMRSLKCFFQKIRAEDLRRLREHQMFSRQRRFDKFLFRLFHSIDDWDCQNRRACAFGLTYDTLNLRGRDKRTNSVMNCDKSRSRLQMLQTNGDGILAAFATSNDPNRLFKPCSAFVGSPC